MMTYGTAIDYFADHGNVASSPDILRTAQPSESQLIYAVEHAVENHRQPRKVAEQAAEAIRAYWRAKRDQGEA